MSLQIKEDNSKEVLSALDAQVAAALEAIGMQAEANAKVEVTSAVYDTPQSPTYVRTGALRNSITHDSDGEAAYVGSNIEYAAYVEMGTSKMSPRPFIRPAVENHMDEYRGIAEQYLKDE